MTNPSSEAAATIGIIGGSGLYSVEGLTDVERVEVDTPFGRPSDRLTTGRIGDVRLVFLPRHGLGHRHSPSEVPYRANVWAMRRLGVTALISVSAVGSLREEIAPGHVVVPDQIIDRTKGLRPATFFEDGIVAHVQFADPYCPVLRGLLIEAARELDLTTHDAGTLVCMEGPAFSTRAESHLYRSWGAHIVGMTALPEAKLAREAELCYATLALATDYDCWHESEEDVSVEAVLAVLQRNTDAARQIVRTVSGRVPDERSCSCGSSLRDALITGRDRITPEAGQRLSLLLDRYVSQEVAR